MKKSLGNDSEEKVVVKKYTKIVIWASNALSIILPLIFYTIMPIFFSDLFVSFNIKFIDETGVTKWNLPVLIYLIVTLLLSITIIVVNCRLSTKDYQIITKHHYDNMIETIDEISANVDIATKMLSAFDDLCKSKEYVLRTLIKNSLGKTELHIITDPESQLRQIFQISMLKVLREFLNYNDSSKKLEVSVAYKYKNNKWIWMDSFEPNRRRNADSLATNPDSTFYHLINSTKNYIFYNSKYQASQIGHYIKNDEMSSDGSIIGRKLYIGAYDNPLAEVVYFFTTNGDDKLIEEKENNNIESLEKVLIKKLENYIFDKFDYRIKIEFELWFLKEFSTNP